ncbi:MAG: response regulator [Planctomycetes bacterium]|nr:response regulator [Planctomycetota bacterium]
MKLEKDANIPKQFRGDPIRIKQILNNLLDNAVKFTEKGSISLNVNSKPPEDNTSNQIRLFFEIEDSGIGLSHEQCEMLFNPFSQADSSTTRKYGGTGLGLAICKDLAKLMHGSIEVSSVIGEGSTFSFNILLNKTTQKASTLSKPTVQKSDTNTEETNQYRVLVVEDNVVNLMITGKMLNKMGIAFDKALDGVMALRSFSGRTQYDLILMDCMMPKMNGYEATEKIRSLEKEENLGNIPIIALTANAMQGDRDKCKKSGMNDFISKPFKYEEFSEIINRNLPSKATAAD